MFVHSLNEKNPVLLNKQSVNDKTFVPNKSVISIGSCNFRFEYHENILSPIKNEITPSKVRAKTGKSPRASMSGKENTITPKVSPIHLISF